MSRDKGTRGLHLVVVGECRYSMTSLPARTPGVHPNPDRRSATRSFVVGRRSAARRSRCELRRSILRQVIEPRPRLLSNRSLPMDGAAPHAAIIGLRSSLWRSYLSRRRVRRQITGYADAAPERRGGLRRPPSGPKDPGSMPRSQKCSTSTATGCCDGERCLHGRLDGAACGNQKQGRAGRASLPEPRTDMRARSCGWRGGVCVS